MTLRPIICLSSQYWRGGWFRKQQFMSRLASAGHPVLYVEPSHSLLRSVGYDGRTKNPTSRSHCEAESPGLWVMTPKRLPPKPHVPWVSRKWRLGIVKEAARRAAQLGMNEPAWWVYDPEYAPALDSVPERRMVFDLVDDLGEYNAEPSRRAYVRNCVEKMASKAGAIICTSEPLAELLSEGGHSAHVVPNGYDADLFFPRRASGGEVGGSSMHRPTVGFVGTLFEYIDYEMIRECASAMADARFVLMGHLEFPTSSVAALLALPNVTHTNAVPRDEVPDHIARFDVCIAPFRQSAVSRSVSPLKVYEYLAMHKPVVCTPMEGLQRERIAQFVDVASSSGHFCSLVSERMRTWSVDLGMLDVELRDCTWDARFRSVVGRLPIGMLTK
jgi:glycosyltransferase involved in cell wall biosynthesis